MQPRFPIKIQHTESQKESDDDNDDDDYDIPGFNATLIAQQKMINVANSQEKTRLYVPLPFHFSTGNPGLALPLIALPYHDVKITVDLIPEISFTEEGNEDSVLQPFKWSEAQFHLETCQVYLDKEERASFADITTEIVIEQVQEKVFSKSDFNRPYCVTFNHAISELIWVNEKVPGCFGGETYKSVSLTFNNHERFDKEHKKDMNYFQLVQPWMHHSRVPGHVYCYNFGLRPEDDQHSGSVSLSGIDNVMFTLNADTETLVGTTKLFARCYNVLKISQGTGGIVYTS